MKKFIAADATKWITENAIHAELGEVTVELSTENQTVV